MIDLVDAVVIIHPLLASVPEQELVGSLEPATWTPTTRTFRFAESKLSLSELADVDWHRLLDELVREDGELQQLLSRAAGPVFYFGMAPIPIALELGRRLGPTRRIVAHQQRHDTKSWRWPATTPTVTARLEGIPAAVSLAQGDVVIRVGCSHPVLVADVRQVVPYPIAELAVEVDGLHEDVLQSDDDVTLVAGKFGDALDAIARYFPNCETIHLFAAVPPALAVRMGAEINPTIHAKPIHTYQYANACSPRYVRALVLGQRARPALTSAQRQLADSTRDALRRSLSAVRSLTEVELDLETWIEDLVGPAGAGLCPVLRRLGPLGRSRMIVDAHIADEREANGEFRWEPEARRWVFDDRLLAALGARLNSTDVEAAGRLFFLHEAIHIAKQGITTANADRVGRLPRVLEEVDYLADVWSLVNDFGRAVRAGETVAGSAAAPFFRERLRVMTATFWTFDAADLPLSTIPVRRLNRYLIWYWIRIALEIVDDLDGVMRLLGTKPILELSGPRVRVIGGRVVFDLDPACFDGVELGLLHDGYRMVRVGTRAGAEVQALLHAVRAGNETSFLAVLRGVFDSVAGDLGTATSLKAT
jgi:hypothetical protein